MDKNEDKCSMNTQRYEKRRHDDNNDYDEDYGGDDHGIQIKVKGNVIPKPKDM